MCLCAGFKADLKLSAVTKLLFIVPSCLVQRDLRKEKDFLYLVLIAELSILLINAALRINCLLY